MVRYWNGQESGLTGANRKELSDHLIRYLRSKYQDKCAQCGWDKIHPTLNKVPLEVHHIDGNWQNNKEENLTLLCPNCHSLTENFKGLNKGNGRDYRNIKSD